MRFSTQAGIVTRYVRRRVGLNAEPAIALSAAVSWATGRKGAEAPHAYRDVTKTLRPCGRRVAWLFELVARVLLGVAIAAVNGAITAGLEGNLRGSAATVADYFVHLTVAAVAATALSAAVTTGRAAGSATGGFVGEALFREELLLRSGEGEFGAAIAAGEGFVCVHRLCTSFFIVSSR